MLWEGLWNITGIGQNLGIMYIDFKKAYDRMPREVL